ncbi:MAG TPA: hypothetical protein VF736_12305, partial [Pyrinomonadaceae bacterium]
ATARVGPGTSAEVGHAETILTGEFESPPAGRSAGARGTVASGSSETRAGDADGFVSTRPEGSRGVAVAEAGAGGSAGAHAPRRSLAPLLAGGALALLLLAGVGGWLAWRASRAPAEAPRPAPGAQRQAAPPAVARVEAASYWFETFDRKEDSSGRRVAEAAPALSSGKWFKFHFVTRQRGYLYVVGPYKDGNAQVMMLTARGSVGLKSNLVGAGADFSFPFGLTKLHLDENPGADDFTFIFSPAPLLKPAFLAGEYLRELTPAEVKELEDFRAQFKADAPEAVVRGEGAERRLTLLVPEPAAEAGRPLVFDVRIDHR